MDVTAQAEIDESRDISGTLNKDQHYYFKITARKDTNGVRVQVKFSLQMLGWEKLTLESKLVDSVRLNHN